MSNYTFDGVQIHVSEQGWKERLTPKQFRILRKGGTERAFYNEYHAHKEEGIYECAGCRLPLYRSTAKYDSATGWPSFWEPICEENVTLLEDKTRCGARVEVVCSRCGGHLGHVFEDGPPPTGKRYCMNSAALIFIPKE